MKNNIKNILCYSITSIFLLYFRFSYQSNIVTKPSSDIEYRHLKRAPYKRMGTGKKGECYSNVRDPS